jgi:hypothetical protein
VNCLPKPFKIVRDRLTIIGILRGSEVNNELIILLPAATGNRIGPQRIYVEIAKELAEYSYATFCVDLPPFGDSNDNELFLEGKYEEILNQRYSKYLQIIIEFFKMKTHFEKFILLSISDGCMPVYKYSRSQEHIKRIILLSPNHQVGATNAINKKNLKHYYIKLFHKETWVKLIFFRLNLRKIFKNIFQLQIQRKNNLSKGGIKKLKYIEDVLVIFAEKEGDLKGCMDFWEKEKSMNNINSYSYNIIRGADHSFFGWNFKRDVEKCILEWLKGKK